MILGDDLFARLGSNRSTRYSCGISRDQRQGSVTSASTTFVVDARFVKRKVSRQRVRDLTKRSPQRAGQLHQFGTDISCKYVGFHVGHVAKRDFKVVRQL